MLNVGNACRKRVLGKLCKDFQTPADAEVHYMSPSPANAGSGTSVAHTQLEPNISTEELGFHESLASIVSVMSQTQVADHMKVVSQLFSKCLEEKGVDSMPEDFLDLVASGLNNLHQSRRSNILYSLAKGIGTLRGDGSDTLFPLKRMPAGLIEYAINFFVASSPQMVWLCSIQVCMCVTGIYFLQMKCPTDYRAWLQTMYVLFGTKFAKIFGGPLWSHAPIMQAESLEPADSTIGALNPVNVSN